MTRTCLTALVLICLSPAAAFAQERGATITIENDKGDNSVIDRTLTRDGATTSGVVTRSVNGADPGVREFERTRDKETGTYSSSSSAISANGVETSSSRAAVCPPGSGSCTYEASRTGPQGGVTSTTGSRARSDDGTVNGSSTTTLPNGEVVNRTLTSAGEPGDRSGSVIIDGPNGTSTREFERTRSAEEGFARNNTVTLPDGRVATSEASGQCTGGVCDRTITRTGPDGKSQTTDGTVTRVGKGEFEQTRTRTNSQTGESRQRNRSGRIDRKR